MQMYGKRNYVDLFNVILASEETLLNEKLIWEYSEICSDFNARKVLNSTAATSSLCQAASNAIIESFRNAINEYFDFLGREHIVSKTSDLEQIEKIIIQRVMLHSKQACERISAEGTQQIAKSQSLLSRMRYGENHFLSRFFEKESKKAFILRKSNHVITTKAAIWFGSLGFATSITAIIITIFY